MPVLKFHRWRILILFILPFSNIHDGLAQSFMEDLGASPVVKGVSTDGVLVPFYYSGICDEAKVREQEH
jgi:hypothetical protein